MLLTKIDHFLKRTIWVNPYFPLFKFIENGVNRKENTAFDENGEKNRDFRGNLYKILERTI